MKGFLLVAAPVAIVIPANPSDVQAQGRQRIQLTPIVGYQWGGGGEVRRGEDRGTVQLDASVAYGIIADFEVRRGAWVEALIYTQPTTLNFTEAATLETRQVDFSNWYFHIGGLFEAQNRGKVKPFGVITLGTTQMAPSTRSSEWFFSFSFGGGLKAYVSERVALRAQARAWVSALSGGSGFYLGTGGAGVSTWIGETSTQGELSAGLSFAL